MEHGYGKTSTISPVLGQTSEETRFCLSGVVEHGDHRGRELGFPTANIPVRHSDIPNGVWAGTASVGSPGRSSFYVAAISIGDRPTYYADGPRLLEANLLAFSGEIYGQTIVVEACLLLRPQQKFTQESELKDQLRQDVDSVRRWAEKAGLGSYLAE